MSRRELTIWPSRPHTGQDGNVQRTEECLKSPHTPCYVGVSPACVSYSHRCGVPGLMRALSEILNVVSFCLGGTPAFLYISIWCSDFCQEKKSIRKMGNNNLCCCEDSDSDMCVDLAPSHRAPPLTLLPSVLRNTASKALNSWQTLPLTGEQRMCDGNSKRRHTRQVKPRRGSIWHLSLLNE